MKKTALPHRGPLPASIVGAALGIFLLAAPVSMRLFSSSCFQEDVRSRYICSPTKMESTTLHGRGSTRSNVNSTGNSFWCVSMK